MGMFRLVAAWALAHFGYRAAVIALPLLAYTETGHAWSVGLVAGAAGIPTITAPWWTRRLQRRLRSARALAGLLAGEGLSTLIVPAAAELGLLTPTVMMISGLFVGTFTALSGPLDSALLAELGERRDAVHGAAQVLAGQETVVRVATTLAPVVTLPLVGMIGPAFTVALEGLLSLVGAALVVGVPMHAHAADEEAPRVRRLLIRHPDIAVGWTVRGVGCAAWFAFTLGLPLLGVAEGRGVVLAAIGLTAYSGGAIVGSALGVLAARGGRPALLNAAAWLVAGLGWIAMATTPTPLVIGACSVVMGLTVPAGNAATTAMVTRATFGLERRAALTAQSTVVIGSSTFGSLVGGPLIGWLGAERAILTAGLGVTVVSLTVTISNLRRSTHTAATPSRDGEVTPTVCDVHTSTT
jgi:MFS family permease